MNLHILDTSNYLYAGLYKMRVISRGVTYKDGEWCPKTAPISGISYLVKSALKLAEDNNNIIMPVFDTPPEIKRQMYKDTIGGYESYKGNRKSTSTDMRTQKNYAYDILSDLGFPVQRAEDYEADDIIHTIVNGCREEYEHIYIHTEDSDLYYLVSSNVSIVPVKKDGKFVDIYNYSTVVDKKSQCLYNTYHLRKWCAGDTSDNIPGVGWEWATALDKIITADDYSKLGDLDLCRKYIRRVITEFPELQYGHRALALFNIICPLVVPDDLLNWYEQEIDFKKAVYYNSNWNASVDIWNLEDMLNDYIEDYNE